MFYRVVMQGRTLGGANLEEVKNHFVRVTGLPLRVAEEMFGGIPQVIKRQVQKTDAERIAATLRAIGAAATVEREVPGTDDETPEGALVIATPFNNGPPTIIPGSVTLPEVSPAAARRARMRRAMRSKWTLLGGGALLVAAAILLAPLAEDYLPRMSGASAPTPARVAPARTPASDIEPVQTPPVINASLLQGPWRCTNQRTGVSAYWSYVANGTLVFHGDVLSEKPPPREIAANAPTKWTVEGQRLSHVYEQRAPDTYTLTQLSLTRLRYGGERGLEIECRRP
jgi:hypothetical protein